MTDAVNEQLSACLDGELSPEQLDLLLKRLERNPELRDAIGRYTLIGEAMRSAKPVIASRSFADQVMATLEHQPQLERPAARRISQALARRLRPIAGIGVAATVAALAIFSVQRTGLTPATVAINEPTTAPVAAVSVATDETSYIVPTTTAQSAFVPATRLTNYVVAHSEYSSPLARRSVVTGVLAGDDVGPGVATAADPAADDANTAPAGYRLPPQPQSPR